MFGDQRLEIGKGDTHLVSSCVMAVLHEYMSSEIAQYMLNVMCKSHFKDC